MVKSKYTIRFCVTYENAIEEHIDHAWKVIRSFATEVLVAASPEKIITKKRGGKKLSRGDSFRFSFTRGVSQEVFERQTSIPRLADGGAYLIISNELLISIYFPLSSHSDCCV